MALSATIYHLKISLSDVDRNVYTELDLRLARHPSESFRFLLTRTLAYALLYEEDLTFNKAGLASPEEAQLAVDDLTGSRLLWVEIGSPSAERLHKASKASPRVVLFTWVELALLRKEAAARPIHRAEELEIYRLEPSFLDEIEPWLTRNVSLEILRNEGRLYLTIGGKTFETQVERQSLLSES